MGFGWGVGKFQSSLNSGTQSDGTMRSFEIQILQIKQSMKDIFDKFEIKTEKDKSKPIIQVGLDADKLKAAFR